MVLIDNVKYACATCIKGHRSSSCTHESRPLFEIKKKGRPVTQCIHCRELRKTKQVHVKCLCEVKPDPSPPQPLILRPDASQPVVKIEEKACGCKDAATCNCCTPRHPTSSIATKRSSQCPSALSTPAEVGVGARPPPTASQHRPTISISNGILHQNSGHNSTSHHLPSTHHHARHFAPYQLPGRISPPSVDAQGHILEHHTYHPHNAHHNVSVSGTRNRSQSSSAPHSARPAISMISQPMIYNHPVAAASSPDLAWLDVNPSNGLFGTLCPDATSVGSLQPSVLSASQQQLPRPSVGGRASSATSIDHYQQQVKGTFNPNVTELPTPAASSVISFSNFSNSNGDLPSVSASNNNLPLGIPELRFDIGANGGIGPESSTSSPLDYDSLIYSGYISSTTHLPSPLASGPPSMSGSASSRSSSPTSEHPIKQEEASYSFVDFATATAVAPSPPLYNGGVSEDAKPALSTSASQGAPPGSGSTVYSVADSGLAPLEAPLSMGMDPFERYLNGGDFKPTVISSPSSQVQAWYQTAPWGSYISQGVDSSSPSSTSYGLNSAIYPMDGFAQGFAGASPSTTSSPGDSSGGVGGLPMYSPVPRPSLTSLKSPPSLWSH